MTTDMHEPDDDTPETVNPRRAMLAGIGLAAGALLASTANAGPLTPPAGAISSTPGPEPRIPINSTNTPGSSGTSSVFRITVPGSYYLTGNISSQNTNRHVIVVAADRVTIDLNGFTVRGLGTIQGDFDCIFAEEGFDSITVKNGFVELAGRHGINFFLAHACAVEGVGANNCISDGIRVGTGSRVANCIARSNNTNGITTDSGSAITNCTASNNTETGISAGPGPGLSTSTGCTVNGCAASYNTGIGIDVGRGSVVVNCAALGNGNHGINISSGCTAENCSARENMSNGISVASGCTITNCTAIFNHFSGITVFSGCLARSNTCAGNGTDNSSPGSSSGITVIGQHNYIENNNCSGNRNGIKCNSFGNFIARNVCSGNTNLNWDIVANNVCFVLNATLAGEINGDSGGVSPGSTNPNANYTF